MKSTIGDLAVLRGTPTFLEPLHVGHPNIGNRDLLLMRLNDMLDRRWFTNNGPYVQEFEQMICKTLHVKHCVAMCNATVALEIACRALELKGEVIVPSFTFIATAHALQWQEITPVFCDVAQGSHHIDPAQIEALITPRTSGIIGVHVWGAPCDVTALSEVAQRHGLRLIFDAAHAFACSYQGKMIGSFGDAEVFSFHATKFLNSFEGGAITTNNDELAARLQYMRNFGFVGYDNVDYVGTNGKMTEICAAMGLTSLESLDEFVTANRYNYAAYAEGLSGIPGITLYCYDDSELCNFQYIVVEIDENITGISRDAVVNILHAENVLARRYFYPGCHQMEPYRSAFPHSRMHLPRTEVLTQRVMTLPTGTTVNPAKISIICDLIRYIINMAPEILRGITTVEHQQNR